MHGSFDLNIIWFSKIYFKGFKISLEFQFPKWKSVLEFWGYFFAFSHNPSHLESVFEPMLVKSGWDFKKEPLGWGPLFLQNGWLIVSKFREYFQKLRIIGFRVNSNFLDH